MIGHTCELCPYTLKPLKNLPETSVEHIFPEALGGTAGFSVRVDRKRNSELGTTVDAPLCSSALVQMFRVKQGITSGTPKVEISGELAGTDKIAKVTIDSEMHLRLDISDQVDMSKDGTSGRILVPADQEDAFLKHFSKGHKRKGRQVEVVGNQAISPEIQSTFTFDLKDIVPGLAKIAYLATFRYLGDEFLSDLSNPSWQALLAADTFLDIMGSPVRNRELVGTKMMDCLLPDMRPYEHAVVVVHMGQVGLVTAVSLFGKSPVSRTFIASSSSTYGLADVEGIVAICDAKNGGTRFLSYKEAMGIGQ